MAKRKVDRTSDTEEILEAINTPKSKTVLPGAAKVEAITNVVSTGSTLLDLEISGGRIRGGGIPGGILAIIQGRSGLGKTALLAEISASAQAKGGECRFCDPESRLDKEYTQIYGVSIEENFEYYRPDTVKELFSTYLWDWEPKDKNKINVFASDSVAALSTELEMEGEDKFGGKQAKEFSAGLRKSARLIASPDKLVVFSNQMRVDIGTGRDKATGGEGLTYYASLIVTLTRDNPFKIEKTKKFNGKDIKKTIGINSLCQVTKSTVDIPYGIAPISIIAGYGIDDVRANLQYVKDITANTKYDCFNDKAYVRMDDAIDYIEENGLEIDLKNRVIDLWEEVRAEFAVQRKKKGR
jgi:RecA/RadA recombinase